MTKEEEIRARLDEDAYWINGVVHIEDAVESIRYLLARNEELQRRVEKMECVVRVVKAAIKDHPEQVCLGIKMVIKSFDTADTTEE